MSPRSKEQTARIRDARRQQLLEIAYQIFSSQGFHGMKMSDLASAASVSSGIAYHYFNSKEELFMAVFEEWVRNHFAQALEDHLSTFDTSSEQLRAFSQYSAQMMTDAAIFLSAQLEFSSHMVRNETIRQRFRELFIESRSIVRQIIQAGVDNGEFRDVDAEKAASICLAVFDGLVIQSVADPEAVDWMDTSQLFMDFVLAYLQMPGEIMKN